MPQEPSHSAVSQQFELVELQRNEAVLYPRHGDVTLESLRGLSQRIGVELVLRSDLPGFSHFLVSVDGGQVARSDDGRASVEFEDNHSVDPQRKVFAAFAVDEQGTTTASRSMVFTFHPAESYAQSGRTALAAVVLEYSEIPFVYSQVSDWLVDTPTAQDVEFARATWGVVVDAVSTSHEKASALAKALLDALDPHRGVPSDIMSSLTPFEQFERAIAGDDHVWCENFAMIFVRAAVALGIPARTIEMTGRSGDTDGSFELLVADGHTTTEIFDTDANRWIWLDLTLNVLGADLPWQGPLNVAGLHRSINDPAVRDQVQLTTYSSATGEEKQVGPTEPGLRDSLLGFFKEEQTYWYTRGVAQ